jgi:hypothetical protein
MSYLKTGITVGLAGALALSAAVPSMAAVPTAIAAIKNAPSDNTVSVRWWGWHHHHGWWGPAIGLGIGLGLLGAAIATSPYYYGGYYGCPPYGYYGGYYGCGYGYPAYYGGYYARPYYGWGWRHRWWHHHHHHHHHHHW